MVQVLALWLLAFAAPQQGNVEVKGYVIAAINGERTRDAIRGVQIRLSSLQQVLSAKTDAAGYFAFQGVPPGNYALIAEAAGFKAFYNPVRLTGREGTAVFDIDLSAAMDPDSCNSASISYAGYQPSQTGHISLEATDSREPHRPIPGVVFTIKGLVAGQSKAQTLIGRDGLANVTLSPGSYTVAVKAVDFHAQEVDILLPRDNATHIRFSLVPKKLQIAYQ